MKMAPIVRILTFASALLMVSGQMQLVYQWNYIDFEWPSTAARNRAIQSGEYNISQVVPLDIDRDRAGRVFVALLGAPGVPATLGMVTENRASSGPLIRPYPNWSWFIQNDCDALQNVYRFAIDSCNRLWALDNGFRDGDNPVCRAQLVVFDLNTDKHIKTIKIPNNIVRDASGSTLLVTPIVDTEGSRCERTTVYIADANGPALIIINEQGNFRLENPIFQPDPEATNITSGSDSITFNGGILGMAVSPRVTPNEEKVFYFHPLASFDMFAIRVSDLHRALPETTRNFARAAGVLPSQALGMAFSSRGTLFFGLTRENALVCWNRYRQLNRNNFHVVAQNAEQLQYINSVKVIRPSPNHPEEELWMLSNRFIGYSHHTLQYQDINFRVFRGSVRNIVTNTICDMPTNRN